MTKLKPIHFIAAVFLVLSLLLSFDVILYLVTSWSILRVGGLVLSWLNLVVLPLFLWMVAHHKPEK